MVRRWCPVLPLAPANALFVSPPFATLCHAAVENRACRPLEPSRPHRLRYKATSCVFPPVAVLAGLLSATSASGKPYAAFVAFPWLAGHAILYGCAMLLSHLRVYVAKMVAAKLA